MIKSKKGKSIKVFSTYAIKLEGTNEYTFAHLAHIEEIDGYMSLTFGFYDLKCDTIDTLRNLLKKINFNAPFLIATVDVNPEKEWDFLGQYEGDYSQFKIQERLSKSGWYENREIGIYPKLECYFGIFPWDLIVGKTSMDNILIEQSQSKYAKYLKEFSADEAKTLGFFQIVKYAGRENELKLDR